MSARNTAGEAAPSSGRHWVGMDMAAPYGVYLDGVEINIYDTEAEAQREFEALRRLLLLQRAKDRSS